MMFNACRAQYQLRRLLFNLMIHSTAAGKPVLGHTRTCCNCGITSATWGTQFVICYIRREKTSEKHVLLFSLMTTSYSPSTPTLHRSFDMSPRLEYAYVKKCNVNTHANIQ